MLSLKSEFLVSSRGFVLPWQLLLNTKPGYGAGYVPTFDLKSAGPSTVLFFYLQHLFSDSLLGSRE